MFLTLAILVTILCAIKSFYLIRRVESMGGGALAAIMAILIECGLVLTTVWVFYNKIPG